MNIKKTIKIACITILSLLALWILVGVCTGPRIRTWACGHRYKPEPYERTYSIEPDRGDIYDCDGNQIAGTNIVYDVHMDCCAIDNEPEWAEKSRRLAQEIALILPDRTAPEWWDYFQNARKRRNRYIKIVKDTDLAMVDTLRTLPLFNEGHYKGGIIISTKEVRTYPYGTLARRTIGSMRSLYNDEYLFGLEGRYNKELTGQFGSRTLRHTYKRGKWIKEEIAYTEKKDGWNLYTTLDMDIQKVADSILFSAVDSDKEIQGGCLALMDVETGAIKALANMHRFEDGRVGEYLNYLVGYSYEPGEVAQTMTLAAALSDGLLTSLDEKLPTNHGRQNDTSAVVDQYIRQYEKRMQTDSISVMDGLAMSSHYVAGQLASRYKDSIDYYFGWFGSFCPYFSDFDVRGSRPLDLVSSLRRDINTVIAMGSGYEFTATPLHILAFYNMIANKGTRVKPFIVDKGMREDESHVKQPQLYAKRILRESTALQITDALSSCTESGTAKIFHNHPSHLVGKTGTSRQILAPPLRKGGVDPYMDVDGKRQYASSFAGFFPAENPEYSVICVLFTKPTDKPIYGGKLPAETVRKFIEGTEDLR